MNRKRGIVCLLFLSLLLGGCQKTTTTKASDLNNQVKEQKDKEQNQLNVSGNDYVLIYYPNQTQSNLLTKKVQIHGMNKDKVCKELVRAGVLDDTVILQKCKPMKEDDKVYLNLDFNDAFQKQLHRCSSMEEQLLIGAVVNSFMSAYPYSVVRMTVNGNLIQSRFAEVDGFWRKYSETEENLIIKEVHYNGKSYQIKGRKFVSEMGFSTMYNADVLDYEYDAKSNVATFSLKGKLFADKAYLAVSVCNYPLRETVEGLQLQSAVPLSLSAGTYGVDQIAGFQLVGQQGNQHFYDYCLEQDGKVYLLEIKYEGMSPEKYIPQLIACVQQFSLLQ